MMRAREEALHNLSRVAFEFLQTVRQGVQAQRLPFWQVKPGNAAAAPVRPNPLRAGALRTLDRRQCSLPCHLFLAWARYALTCLSITRKARRRDRDRFMQSFPNARQAARRALHSRL